MSYRPLQFINSKGEFYFRIKSREYELDSEIPRLIQTSQPNKQFEVTYYEGRIYDIIKKSYLDIELNNFSQVFEYYIDYDPPFIPKRFGLLGWHNDGTLYYINPYNCKYKELLESVTHCCYYTSPDSDRNPQTNQGVLVFDSYKGYLKYSGKGLKKIDIDIPNPITLRDRIIITNEGIYKDDGKCIYDRPVIDACDHWIYGEYRGIILINSNNELIRIKNGKFKLVDNNYRWVKLMKTNSNTLALTQNEIYMIQSDGEMELVNIPIDLYQPRIMMKSSRLH